MEYKYKRSDLVDSEQICADLQSELVRRPDNNCYQVFFLSFDIIYFPNIAQIRPYHCYSLFAFFFIVQLHIMRRTIGLGQRWLST